MITSGRGSIPAQDKSISGIIILEMKAKRRNKYEEKILCRNQPASLHCAYFRSNPIDRGVGIWISVSSFILFGLLLPQKSLIIFVWDNTPMHLLFPVRPFIILAALRELINISSVLPNPFHLRTTLSIDTQVWLFGNVTSASHRGQQPTLIFYNGNSNNRLAVVNRGRTSYPIIYSLFIKVCPMHDACMA